MNKMTEPAKTPVEKVAVYFIGPRGLLVFDQPSYPHVPPQVPGGTVELREAPQFAARREFEEETGITCPKLNYLGQDVWRPKVPVHYDQITRHFFTARIDEQLPATWQNWEMSPADGSPPVLFHFRWIRVEAAKTELLDHFRTHLHLLPAEA